MASLFFKAKTYTSNVAGRPDSNPEIPNLVEPLRELAGRHPELVKAETKIAVVPEPLWSPLRRTAASTAPVCACGAFSRSCT